MNEISYDQAVSFINGFIFGAIFLAPIFMYLIEKAYDKWSLYKYKKERAKFFQQLDEEYSILKNNKKGK